MSGCLWKAFMNSREWLRGPPRCLGVVGMPSRMSGSGRVALLDVQEWSRDRTECLGVM